MKIQALIHPAEAGGYWAEAPALGCTTEEDAIALYRRFCSLIEKVNQLPQST
jgi:predicted RNase H-like HicB family nuclease